MQVWKLYGRRARRFTLFTEVDVYATPAAKTTEAEAPARHLAYRFEPTVRSIDVYNHCTNRKDAPEKP